jgi:hypothetical protein
VKSAHDSRSLITGTPSNAGAIHDRLIKLLGSPRKPMAAPIVVANRIACMLVVGDALGPGNPEAELSQLALALGDAYERVLRDMK